MLVFVRARRKSTRPTRRTALIGCGASLVFSLGTCSISTAGDARGSVETGGGRARTADARPSSIALDELPEPLSGRRVYKRICMACHTLSVWGAPKLGDRVAWAKRLSKGREALYLAARNGFNEMPPRGNCQFCTDDEIRAAVDYMVEKAQPRPRNEQEDEREELAASPFLGPRQ